MSSLDNCPLCLSTVEINTIPVMRIRCSNIQCLYHIRPVLVPEGLIPDNDFWKEVVKITSASGVVYPCVKCGDSRNLIYGGGGSSRSGKKPYSIWCSCDESTEMRSFNRNDLISRWNYRYMKTKPGVLSTEIEIPSSRNDLLACDVCKKPVEDPYHYSTEYSRHMHACDECWPSVKVMLLKQYKE